MKLLDEMYNILETHDNEIRIKLKPEHFIYTAHFPGHPVTPGVCIIKMIKEILELKFSRELMLKEIKNIKFIDVISPLEVDELTVKFNEINADAYVKARGVLHDGNKIYTKFSLIFQ